MARKQIKPPAEDDVIALYAHLLLRAQESVKRQQRRLAALAKEAGQHGVTWAEVKGALKEYEQSPEARRAKAERQARIFGAIGAPVQIEMFDAYEPKRNDTIEDAKRKGRFAAICYGVEANPPYPAGTAEGQAWLEGWHDVQNLVAAYHRRFEEAEVEPFQAPAEAGDDWDDKPVENVEALNGVNHE